MKLNPPQDRFTPNAASITEDVFCGICCLKMNVERNQKIFRGMVEAMVHHNDPEYQRDICDVYTCPNRELHWHYQVYLLHNEMKQTSSSAIAKLLQEEIDTILFTKKPTKRFFNPHSESYSME